MIVAHNMTAMFTQRQLNMTETNQSKSANRLASGYRINRAADDSAGLAISEKLRSQIRGLRRGGQNVQDGINFCSTGEGALQEVHNILHRVRELSVQAANDTNTEEDRQAIQEEIQCLKYEINRISMDTEYNRKVIFNEPFQIELSDTASPVQIFNASNGDPTDPNTYGGIILDSKNRVPWTSIPNMTRMEQVVDPNTGQPVINPATGQPMEQLVFNGGTYTVNGDGYQVTLDCKDGTTPPNITVEFPITVENDGLCVSGRKVPWSAMVDDDGVTMLEKEAAGMPLDGMYHFPVGRGEGGFTVIGCNTLDEVKAKLDDSKQVFNRKYVSDYDGYHMEKAVDIMDVGSKLQITNANVVPILSGNSLGSSLGADNTGIWLNDTTGAMVAGSKRTWAQLGLANWDSGPDIDETKTYKYQYRGNGYDINYDFTLLAETSKESVIDGINNAVLQITSAGTNTATGAAVAIVPGPTGTSVIQTGQMVQNKTKNTLTLREEYLLGRNFDAPTGQFEDEQLVYDPATDKLSVTFYDDSNPASKVLEYVDDNTMVPDTLKGNAKEYLVYIQAREMQRVMDNAATRRPDTAILNTVVPLKDFVHNPLQPDGRIDVDPATMAVTKGISSVASARYLRIAEMDFSGLGSSFQLYDLLGTGFESTCCTCNAHYSLMFAYDLDGFDNVKTKGNYKYRELNQGGGNYTLQVDLKPFMEMEARRMAGGGAPLTGGEFARMLVDVVNNTGFTGHYTQYAADNNGKFYVLDRRSPTEQKDFGSATFASEPYELGISTLDINLKEVSSDRNIALRYTYKLNDSLLGQGQLVADPAGMFAMGGNGKLHVYNPASDGPTAARYSVDMTSVVQNVPWAQYYDQVMQAVADSTRINLRATNYDKVGYYADENPNSAIVSDFAFKILDDRYAWIQAGANAWQGIAMKWDTFSTHTMGITFKDVLSHENASEMLWLTDKAISAISDIRSVFGAYMNRMEYAYAVDSNTEENLQAAESKLRDTDMAEELTQYARDNILKQSAQSLLVQACRSKEGVLRLLS